MTLSKISKTKKLPKKHLKAKVKKFDISKISKNSKISKSQKLTQKHLKVKKSKNYIRRPQIEKFSK